MANKLAWGILSTGNISKAFVRALPRSESGYALAVASRTQEAADRFGDEFGIERRYGSYDAMLADPDVQAVYISTPHPMHAEWAIRAADAGKHILCEKPITLDYAEAMAVFEAARRNDVFLMEAFMYRCHPQTAKLVELIRNKVIGDVRMIQATFSFDAGFNLQGRLLNPALGGGGILDVGCYCASMTRLIAGAAQGMPFANPIEVKGMGKLGEESRVDEYTMALMRFPGDIIAQLSTGVRLSQENVVRIFGTEGNIVVPSPWFCTVEPGTTEIIVNRYGVESEVVGVEAKKTLYAYEIDATAECLDQRQGPSPCMTWDDTLGNMKTLDLWRQSIGLLYDSELPTASFPTVDRRPLAPRPGNNMKYGQVEGLDKPVSRIVCGTMVGGSAFLLPESSVMFDEFFASGGNTFDTAHIYGPSDALLGQWMKNRGNRDQVVVIGKGAHTPWCNPTDLTSQLMETLGRMQTDYLDIYLMHRDNPEIPVGEFVDVLNEHKRAGRIKAFGGSNWSVERVGEANEYAMAHGLTGFSAVSNNFSLAHMVQPVWAGAMSATDPESIAWFTKTRMPLFAWSSLARGFFVKGNPADTTDPSMVVPWYSDDNFRRLARARAIAEKKGVLPVQIALAYVLNQPNPVHALIGPANPTELHISLAALDIQLTPDELAWLNLEA